jgi:dTDP-4-amino-4,6-dideoxygalactose transaminase
MNSGTDALLIGLHALGIQPGDEVITTSFTFFATAEAISRVGATPVFVDIVPDTFEMDTEALASAIGPRTRAILPVHIFGQAVDMNPLLAFAEEHGLAVLEDVAQAFGGTYEGRKLGSLGDGGAFSFYPSKNLGAYGDGGLLATNDDIVARRARALREHGSLRRYAHEMLGYNSRLDELQAAILRVKLPHVDGWNQARRRVAREYNERLSAIPRIGIPVEAGFASHVYHQYTVRILEDRRDQVQRALEDKEIGSAVHYPRPVHELPPYADRRAQLPQTELACKQVLSLPIWPELDSQTLTEVTDTLASAL